MPPRDPTPRALGYRMPAEWAQHAATWLAWPHNRDDWPGKFDRIPPVFCEIARHLAEVERVRIIVDGAEKEADVRRLLEASRVNLASVDFFHAPTDRSWTRDF